MGRLAVGPARREHNAVERRGVASVGEGQDGIAACVENISWPVLGVAKWRVPIAPPPMSGCPTPSKVLPPPVPESAGCLVGGVANPVDELVNWQAVRVELATKGLIARPQVEAQLHSIPNVLVELLQVFSCFLVHLHTIDSISHLCGSPLKAISVELTANVELGKVHLLLVALWTWHAIDQVELHDARAIALGTKLFKVQLIPENVALLGPFLPQEERTNHPICTTVLNACLKFPILMGKVQSELCGRDALRCGHHPAAHHIMSLECFRLVQGLHGAS